MDFGSTFTKVVLLDTNQEEIIGRGMAPSTVEKDLGIGLKNALKKMDGWSKAHSQVDLKLACSSAAGGLKIAAIGLVTELTVEAAKQAALGAGGRVTGTYSHRLSKEDVKRLEDSKPDIVLLSGGTDGGDSATVVHNSQILSESGISCPVVLACNKEAGPKVEETLTQAGKNVIRTENVMPELSKLNVEPAKKIIRELFIRHITKAKGLDKIKEFVEVLMPTPSASLAAAELLSQGTTKEHGLGDLMIVEVGGATTNVHSILKQETPGANVIRKGLPEERVKRTVEGDLGVRVSAPSLVEAAGPENFRKLTGRNSNEHIEEIANRLAKNPPTLPLTEADVAFDNALVKSAVRIAVQRHVGNIEEVNTPAGRYYLQTGKDFRRLGTIVGSGGAIVYSSNPSLVLDEAVDRGDSPNVLKPKSPRKFIDTDYVLWAAGLLASQYPDSAFHLLKNSLKSV